MKASFRLLLAASVVATIGCDRVTKHVATVALANMPMKSYAADTVRLAYTENAGGFLSIGATLPGAVRTTIFIAATGVLLLGLAVFAIRSGVTGASALGLALFVSGGASNWFDRIVQGRVVDFMNVGFGPVRTGIFNVADVAIMAGALMFIFGEFIKRRPPRLT